jgi:hypothetical protein
MRFSRSFFLPLVCIAATIPMAAQEDQGLAQPSPEQPSSEMMIKPSTQPVPTPFRPDALSDYATLDSTGPSVARQFSALKDRACLMLRMYKVKRTERVAEGESAWRGYTTCEWASNYQMRSAVAHARDAGKAAEPAR